MLDQTPLQLEKFKLGRGVGGDYSREAINQGTAIIRGNMVHFKLQSWQVKCTPQDSINEFIIRKLNPLVVVDFRFISACLHE